MTPRPRSPYTAAVLVLFHPEQDPVIVAGTGDVTASMELPPPARDYVMHAPVDMSRPVRAEHVGIDVSVTFEARPPGLGQPTQDVVRMRPGPHTGQVTGLLLQLRDLVIPEAADAEGTAVRPPLPSDPPLRDDEGMCPCPGLKATPVRGFTGKVMPELCECGHVPADHEGRWCTVVVDRVTRSWHTNVVDS